MNEKLSAQCWGGSFLQFFESGKLQKDNGMCICRKMARLQHNKNQVNILKTEREITLTKFGPFRPKKQRTAQFS